jgi:hypothetical protein
LFPVFLYSFSLPHKNMKTYVAPFNFVRFRYIFIPTYSSTLVKMMAMYDLGGGLVGSTHRVPGA